MKRTWILLIVMGWVAALAGAPAMVRAEDSVAPVEAADEVGSHRLSFEWSTTYASSYEFQGLDYSEGRPVLQPTLGASYRGFSAGVWGNADQTRRHFDEFDVTVQRDLERGGFTGALGYEYLHFPHREGWEPTHEVYVEMALEGVLAPSLSMHWDVVAGEGRYWTLGVEHEFALPKGSMALGTAVHVQEHYYGMTGIPSMETSVSYAHRWGGLSIEPELGRTWAWANGDFRDEFAIESGWVVSLKLSPAE